MMNRFSTIISIFASICILSCSSFKPLDHDRADTQYDFAAQALDAYFIYREQLPPDLYAFDTPQELYLSVDEPYTVFYDEAQAAALLRALSTAEGGIGIRIDSVVNGYLIKDVFKKSPAAIAGLRSLDTIIRVDDRTIAGLTWNEVAALLKGEISTPVVLRIKRNAELLNITVTRGEYVSPSVFVDSINAVTASIIVTGFYDATSDPDGSLGEFSIALDSTSWADYTIVDLRGNPGGYVHQCVAMISLLVPEGTHIIDVKERRVDTATGRSEEVARSYVADGPGTYANRILYLLVDKGTASASEIMVSCLMHRDGVTVLGDTTYGKARGQVLLEGPESVLAKITSMVLMPADDSIHSYDLVGICPDQIADSVNAFDMALNDIENISAAAKRLALGERHYPARRDGTYGIREPSAILRVKAGY